MAVPKRLRAAALNLVAVALGLVVALLLCEVVLRIHNPIETRVRGGRIVLPASKTYELENTGLRGTDRRIVHTRNALGLRGPELPPGGLDNWFGIFCVGGSTTECFYLSDGKDWPEVLGADLEGTVDSVWVNNAGLDGHSTFGHIILTHDILLPLHPKMIVYLIGTNDVSRADLDPQVQAQVRGQLRFGSPEAALKSIAAYSEVASVALTLYRYARARTLGLPHRSIDVATLPTLPYSQAVTDSVIAYHRERFIGAYRNRVAQLVNMCRESGVRVVLVTQPLLPGRGIDPVTGVNLETIEVHGWPGREKWEVLEAYNDVVREWSGSPGVLVVDLARELPRRSDYFYDYTHFTVDGAREVARIIADGIVDGGVVAGH